jgi:hypothetical protein
VFVPIVTAGNVVQNDSARPVVFVNLNGYFNGTNKSSTYESYETSTGSGFLREEFHKADIVFNKLTINSGHFVDKPTGFVFETGFFGAKVELYSTGYTDYLPDISESAADKFKGPARKTTLLIKTLSGNRITDIGSSSEAGTGITFKKSGI